MELNEVLKGLDIKIKGIGKISGRDSKHFAFKNWHAATLALLRELPSSYSREINVFKKFTFETTGYKRGKIFASQTDTIKYAADLDTAKKILNEIVGMKRQADNKKETDHLTEKKPKPDKPPAKKTGSKKTSAEKKAKKTGTDRKPAKTGTSSSRKKK